MNDGNVSDGQAPHRHVYLLDYLMRLRQEKTRGLLLNMGDINVTHHERAIRKFLDFVAEFVALRARERQGS